MQYTFEEIDNIVILTIRESLLGYNEQQDLTAALQASIAEGHKYYIVDLSDLKAINSSGLTVLITLLTQARNVGGDVILAKIPKNLSKLLVITKLNAIFTTASSIEAAQDLLLSISN